MLGNERNVRVSSEEYSFVEYFECVSYFDCCNSGSNVCFCFSLKISKITTSFSFKFFNLLLSVLLSIAISIRTVASARLPYGRP